MSWRDRRPQPQNTTDALLRRIADLEKRIALQEQTGPTSLQLIDFEDYEDAPYENVNIGETHINWPGVHREARRYDPAIYFHDEKWRALGSNAAVYEIKVFEDDEPNLVKDRAFVWEVPEDLDGGMVMKAGAFVTTAGGDNELEITVDGGGSILDSTIQIPAGEKSSRAGVSPQAEFVVEWGGDQLSINTLAASGMGLGVWVLVAGSGVGGVLLQGYKGDPGGITNPRGNYDPATTYEPGDAVFIGGSTYITTVTNVGVIPGVTAGWEDFFMQLTEGTPRSTLNFSLSTGGYNMDTGIKGYKKVPYDATISNVTLLADVPGSVTVDIWKSTFGGHPAGPGQSITGGNPATLATQVKSSNSTLTGWNTSIAAGDILTFYVSAVDAFISRLGVEIELERV